MVWFCQTRSRLTIHSKAWRKDHPFGFVARPEKTNGVLDLKKWTCSIPGKDDSIWAGGLFKLEMQFPDEYPTKPPKCELAMPYNVHELLTDTSCA